MPIINQVVKGGGTTPTGTMYIISNGTYNVADKAIANVNVPTTAPAHYIEKTVDADGKLVNGSSNIINLNGVTDVDTYVLSQAYFNNTAISGAVDMSGLTTLSGSNACYYMFTGCRRITSANLSALTTISGSSACQAMFQNCTALTSFDLSALTTISESSACGSMFQNCTALASADLPSLTTISGNSACGSMFAGCTVLQSIKINRLNVITGLIAASYAPMFNSCTKLESVELGGLTASTFASRTDQIAYLFNNGTGAQTPNGCTVHFPSNFDPADPNHTFDASTLTGYPFADQ